MTSSSTPLVPVLSSDEAERASQSDQQNPTPQPYLQSERFEKYKRIIRFLRYAGFPDNYHTLSELSSFRREIIRINDPALHLVWNETTPTTQFIKPFPKEYVKDDGTLAFDFDDLTPESCGFLYSYTRIVDTELDFEIAVQDKLLEGTFEGKGGWLKWTRFQRSFINGRSRHRILECSDARYGFGDLRLHRLNWIMWLRDWGGHFYHTRDPVLSFWHGYGKWVILVFAYSTTLLTAMQVGLAGSTQPPWLTMTFKWFAYAIIIGILVQFPFFIIFYLVLGIKQVWGWARRTSGGKEQ